jgi:hypothetical protein
VKSKEQAVSELLTELAEGADFTFVPALQRYFPDGVKALGVSNADVVALANGYFAAHPTPAEARLEMAELMLKQATYHEEVLLGFALLHKVVRRKLRRHSARPVPLLAGERRLQLGPVRRHVP